jgi:hypothetical protein
MGTQIIATEQISEATVSLIEPVVIPDLFSKSGELRPEFSFLGSVEEYAQYYLELERPTSKQAKRYQAAFAGQLGPLLPLYRKHSLNSYWRCFRFRIEKSNRQGNPESVRELFLLLPLVLNLPIKPIRANGREFSAEANAYIFPFGSCVVNMDVRFSKILLSDFVDLIPNLKRASVALADYSDGEPDWGCFSRFSERVAKRVVFSLFGHERPVVPFDVHTLLFVRKMVPPDVLQFLFDSHRRAIAATMTGQTYQNVLSLKNVDDCFPAELANLRTREILLFHPKGSFFYASPDWQKPVAETSPLESAKLRRKAECMRSNYQSFLNVLFAVNRFLKICILSRNAEVSKDRFEAVKNSFRMAFLTDPSRVYYKHAFEKIAPLIGLEKSLQEL